MLTKKMKGIYQDILLTTQHFPVPTLFIYFFYVLSMSISIRGRHCWLPNTVVNNADRYLYLCACGYLLFISCSINKKIYYLYRYLLSGVLFFVIAWYLFTDSNPAFTFIFSSAGLFVLLFVAPFLYNSNAKLEIWTFGYDFLNHLIFVLLSTSSLFAGVFSIIEGIKLLFNVQFYQFIYLDVALIIFALLLPLMIIVGVSKTTNPSEYNYPEKPKAMFIYFIVPLLLIYTAMLWIYILKMLFSWQIPIQKTIYLVFTHSFLSLLTYLATYPLHNNKGIIELFSKQLWRLQILPLAAYAVSLGLRIHSFGITKTRYILLLYWLWLASMMIFSFFTFFKRKNNPLKLLLATAAAIPLMVVLGPWRATAVAAQSQRNQLASLLIKHNLLHAGKIHKSTQPIPLSDQRRISAIVDYLITIDKISYIAPWFSDLEDAHLQRKQEYYDPKLVLQDMGIPIR